MKAEWETFKARSQILFGTVLESFLKKNYE